MPTAATPRGTLYYTPTKPDYTDYPPLVLVHGAGGSHLDWPPELRRLHGVRVLALDLPGHGRSEGESGPDTMQYAQAVGDFLNALSIDRAIIAGHSMGGAIAQLLGIHMPDRVAGLILIGTGSKLPVDPSLPQRIVDDPEATLDWITEWAWSKHAPDQLKQLGRTRLSQTATETLRADYLACQAFDVRDQIQFITAPTLILSATDDHMVKPKFGITLNERIPNSTLVMVENAGHMFPLEQSQIVTDAIRTWLTEQVW